MFDIYLYTYTYVYVYTVPLFLRVSLTGLFVLWLSSFNLAPFWLAFPVLTTLICNVSALLHGTRHGFVYEVIILEIIF